jgi:propanol-preferring alcohol dehydrogenase
MSSWPLEVSKCSTMEITFSVRFVMRAMLLERQGSPLQLTDLPQPQPHCHQLMVKVNACAVCRTDLHVVAGELAHPKHALIPGHQIVGTVEKLGKHATHFALGDRVGVPWLGWTCGDCHYCRTNRENLCDDAKFTGYQLDGGFAEYMVADERFCFSIPAGYSDLQAAPLLCGGMIGYRALQMTGDAERVGFYGFGSAAHILIQVARHQGREVYAFTRPGDIHAQQFACQLGAVWAGDTGQFSSEDLDAAIIFAPAGELVPTALAAVEKGGTVVCAGIHMSDIPSFPYSLLWGERTIRSVANLTRSNGEEFLALAGKIPVQTEIQSFPLEAANEALEALRAGKIQGSAVLSIADFGVL